MNRTFIGFCTVLAVLLLGTVGARAGEFATVEPILSKYCYECHGEGARKGGMAFDQFSSDAELLADTDLWLKVVKNLRAGVMPPQKHARPTADEQAALVNWVKKIPFHIDPANIDPGRNSLRRLNRVEYRNTIRDLMGVEYNTLEEFPPDDTGYGFDTIGDVLTVSPLLLEKYMQAAEKIVADGVPTVSKLVGQQVLKRQMFRTKDGCPAPDRLTFYNKATLSSPYKAEHTGTYKLTGLTVVHGDFDFDPGKCKVVFKVDGEPKWSQELVWEDGKKVPFELTEHWQGGNHRLSFELHPLTPIEEKKTAVDLQIVSVRVEGPLEKEFWKAPKNYNRFFPREEPPAKDPQRKEYARELLRSFSTKAFRRPVDEHTLDRQVALAESIYTQPGKSFEQGVARAMVAVLSSPRFLFRVEGSAQGEANKPFGQVDEYALASRLSYFLWSTMPDDELFGLAAKGELRKNLSAQVKRMMADPRSQSMIENFTGQWLQTRDVEGISIDARLVLARDAGLEKEQQKELEEFRAKLAQLQAEQEREAAKPIDPNFVGPPAPPRNRIAEFFKTRKRLFAKPAVELDGALREAMRLEPQLVFTDIVRGDRSLSELLDCDWTYLNAKLAKLYGVPGVKGDEMRRVTLPEGTPRGGLITMGSVLVVTSNPTRTSPVKRGQFILDNLLGMPTPPPPANIPPLEDSEKNVSGHEPTVREALQIHRDQALCRSCHSRMDPLGFSLENFNPMGMWREKERGQEIDASGTLITGESFHDVRDLKKILKSSHRTDFYRCLAEKLLTYAIGRGLEYYDVETVDEIVRRMERADGRFSALLAGVIESTPFQERRNRMEKAAQR